MRARWPYVVALGIAIALYVLSRTQRGQAVAVDIVGGIVDPLSKFLDAEEGLRLTVYKDTGGAWTVGRGHLVVQGDGLYPFTAKRTITPDEAEAFFSKDVSEATHAVDDNVKPLLRTNERTALRSLAFNIGSTAFRKSTLLRLLNAGDKQGAADQFGAWIYDNGVINHVLVARRERERQLFLTV